MAAPSPAEIQYQFQHSHDDTSNQIISALAVCLGFALIAVLLRFVARHITRASLCGDDWTIIAGLVRDFKEQLPLSAEPTMIDPNCFRYAQLVMSWANRSASSFR